MHVDSFLNRSESMNQRVGFNGYRKMVYFYSTNYHFHAKWISSL